MKGRDILLLDSDTFIFSDVAPLFDNLKEYDIVADKTEWGAHGGKIPLFGSYVTPFNSGVVLFKGDLLQRYGSAVIDLCLDIKHERNDIGRWYGDYERSHGITELIKSGREEVAFSLWVMREKLRHRFFNPDEVQTVNLSGSTRIYHTMTQNWFKAWKQFYKGTRFLPPKKMQKRLFLNVSS